MKSIAEQLKVIKRGIVELISEEELIKKLEERRPLRIKAGFDPTAPDLHLGHTVLLKKLKDFQALEHEVCFLIGNYTAGIGDPTGRNETRPPLSEEQIAENVKTYQEQVFKILDPGKTRLFYNADWFGKWSAVQLLKLQARITTARIQERDDFEKRHKAGTPVSLHELVYPLLQGWDSVEMKADVELGGTDQKFNLLMGRHLQKQVGQKEQAVLTLPLLEGLDGIEKMSKSKGNCIGIIEPPSEMFGKILSINDSLMWRYYDLLSALTSEEINSLKKQVGEGSFHPKQAKVNLAKEMVARFHSAPDAEHAAEEFDRVFKKKDLPEDVTTIEISSQRLPLLLTEVMVKNKLAESNSKARSLIGQNAVSLNNEKVSDLKYQFTRSGEFLLKVGKRHFLKIHFSV
ncbi:MAG: tyrosine--tRNA ligase [Deltaproteobacteria bacterium]|nr:tyrosine--tRNA ligase [Deltaproteobacteria bacterium]